MQHKLILVDTNCFCPSCKAKIDTLSTTPSVKTKAVKPKMTLEEIKKRKSEYMKVYLAKRRKAKLAELAKTNPIKVVRMVKRGKIRSNTTIAINAIKNAGAIADVILRKPQPMHKRKAKLTPNERKTKQRAYAKEWYHKNKAKKTTSTKLSIKAETSVSEATVAENVQPTVEVSNTNVTDEPKRLGRPPVPGSKRQLRIQELAERKASGQFKLGRPINPNCKKQIKEKQKQELIAQGIVPKRGRPKFIKPEVTTTEVI